jgi:Putative peptidoglycan binding domain
VSSPANDTITGPLCLGSNGDDVVLLQALLMAASGGAARLKVDGKFGVRTYRAVVWFQRQRKLWVDGIVGPKTAAALGVNYRKRLPRRPVVPGAAISRLPTAQQIIADALLAPMAEFVKAINAEILKSGADEERTKKAVNAMEEIILDGFQRSLKRFAEYPLMTSSAMDIHLSILELQNETLEYVASYLKKYGGKVGAIVDRVNKLDSAAIERIVQYMLDGKEDADAAAWDIGQVMRRALR